MSELDLKNLDDILIIAVELLHDLKVFDQSVFNPNLFIELSLLEFGLTKSPQNKSFIAWQVKIYSKLGLTSLVTDLCNKIAKPEQGSGHGTSVQGSPAAIEYEKVGCIRYSHYTNFMGDRELDSLCRQYKKHFESNNNDGKNKIVECFKRKDFDPIPDIMNDNNS